MSEKIAFVLELTRQEAIHLALLHRSSTLGSWGNSEIGASIWAIGRALTDIDRSLIMEQMVIYQKMNEPTFGIVGTGDMET